MREIDETLVITFEKTDKEGILHPHDNELVVNLLAANFTL